MEYLTDNKLELARVVLLDWEKQELLSKMKVKQDI